MQSLKLAMSTQMHQACENCYPVREHGAGPGVKVRSWHQVNCGKRSEVVTYGVVRDVAFRCVWSKREATQPTGCYVE